MRQYHVRVCEMSFEEQHLRLETFSFKGRGNNIRDCYSPGNNINWKTLGTEMKQILKGR